MCTCVIAGRKATADGSVFLGANDDWVGTPGQLLHIPRTAHGPDAVFRTIRGFALPQPPWTFAYSYTCCLYPIGHRAHAWIEGINEHQVAIAQAGVHAFQPIAAQGAALEADDISWLVLERARSAREAILLIGQLIADHGFTVSSWVGGEGVAVFGIADPREGWWLEIAPGNHWIAQRVPDDMASVRVNCFAIHDADLTDTENTLSSPGLAEYAAAQGWGGDPRHFDFSSIYGADTSINEWGPEQDKINTRRRWRAMSLLLGREIPEETLLYQGIPERPLELKDITAVLRDVYAGTRYDLTKSPDAGVHGNPFHDAPESYSLAQLGTVASSVAQLRSWLPDALGGILWTCLANPHTGFYFPVFAGLRLLPPRFSDLAPAGGRQSVWWLFQDICYLATRRYHPHMALIRNAQTSYEAGAISRTRQLTEALDLLWETRAETAQMLLDQFQTAELSRMLTAAEELLAVLKLQY